MEGLKSSRCKSKNGDSHIFQKLIMVNVHLPSLYDDVAIIVEENECLYSASNVRAVTSLEKARRHLKLRLISYKLLTKQIFAELIRRRE